MRPAEEFHFSQGSILEFSIGNKFWKNHKTADFTLKLIFWHKYPNKIQVVAQ